MSKYTPETVADILTHISEGCNNKDAALISGISEDTFYAWLKEKNPDGTPNPEYHSEFSESLKKAIAMRKRKLVNDIITEKSWQAKAWYLERVHSDEFREKKTWEITNPEDKIRKASDIVKSAFKKEEDESVPSPSETVVQGQGGESVSTDKGSE